MRLSFRAKLLVIVGATLLAVVLLMLVGAMTSKVVDQELTRIDGVYLPMLEIGPQLDSDMEHLRRAFQDAVASQDEDRLGEALQQKALFLERLARTRDMFPIGEVATVRDDVESYCRTADELSRRLIAGETGEAIVDLMNELQAKDKRATASLTQMTAFDRGDLGRAFATVRNAQQNAERVQLAIAVVGIAFLSALALWIARRALRALDELSAGFARFGRGDFAEPMRILSSDEIGSAAHEANRMAENLRKLSDQQDATVWIKTGQAGLAREIAGELEPAQVARRAIVFLAKHTGALAGAVYEVQPDQRLNLVADYARQGAVFGRAVVREFRSGEGLVGEAALRDELSVVTDPADDELRLRTGLEDVVPKAVALLPIRHSGTPAAVVELALMKSISDAMRELLRSVSGPLAIAFEAAKVRTAKQALLVETQRQAAQLIEREEQLRQTNDELMEQTRKLEAQRCALEERHRDLEEARTRLTEKARELSTVSAYKSQFLANMSHELRTPLNSMLLLSSLLAENEGGRLTDKQVEFAGTIHAAGQDLLSLIDQVLDLARIESGKQETIIEPVSLLEVAVHAKRVFEPLAENKGLEFRLHVDTDAPEIIHTDRRRLEQILINLIGNAIKFTDQGSVALSIARSDDASGSVMLSISDTGPGIPPEHRDRIFAPFEQLDASTQRKHGGSGLGLSIARELSTLLGGHLMLSTFTERGSTFRLYLPERPGARAAQEAPPGVERPDAAHTSGEAGPRTTEQDPWLVSSAAPIESGDTHLMGVKVLVVDDDVRAVFALSALLGSHGVEVLNADNGRAALDALSAHPDVNAVLMDIMMPEMDGYEAMRCIRADERFANLPIVALTAKAMKGDRDKCIEAGASDYATKPVDRTRLLSMLRAWVTQGEGSRDTRSTECGARVESFCAS
jgi:two-component system chemotaxis sensor kinase CheA